MPSIPRDASGRACPLVVETPLPVRRARAPIVGALAGVIGMAFGAISLAYPFGRDQGLYYYIAREWLRTDAIPYRDVFDQKTPGIYALHALLITLLGERQWSIRLAEWLAMIPLGLAAARLGTRRDDKTPAWLSGAGILVANLFYFGFFDFWNTGQCEIWCSVLVVGALWAVLRSRAPLVLAAAAAGLCSGWAIVMKPPCAPMVLVVVVALGLRAFRAKKLVASLASFTALFVVTIGGVIAVFVSAGAFSDLVDVLLRLNSYYIAHDRGATSLGDIAEHVGRLHHDFDPLSTALHIALAVALFRGGLARREEEGARARHALAAALVVAATAGVVMQMKFYVYHWGLLVAGETVAAMAIVADVAKICTDQSVRRAWGSPARVLATAAALFALSWGNFARFCACVAGNVTWATGVIDRETYNRVYTIESGHYYYHDSELVGRWLKERSNPGDRVLVRGFQPEIYAVSGLSYGGRFFWDDFLTNPKRAYRRAEWLEQDRSDLERVKPRWVLAIRARPDLTGWPEPTEIQSAAYFQRLGYKVREEMFQYAVMERAE